MKSKILYATLAILMCYTIINAQYGSLDLSFDPETGANSYVHTTSIQSDGRIIIGGEFTIFNGMEINHIARLASTITGIHQLVNESKNLNIFPNPFNKITTLEMDVELKNATFTVYNSSGQSVKQIKNISGQTIILNRDNLPVGLYFIQLSQDNQIMMTDKLVITD